jgi:alkanesulfonate monooxygenase SsuD/methylene tetrahydromethanopterin reductase-like flavin-dependent oxidoreductase (luciferase family)
VRRGVWLFPAQPASRLVEAIVAAEAAGLDEVWLADEGVAREPVPVLAAAAVRTERIRLAIGVTSPVLRHPGALAASAMTVDELSCGRAVLGLGVGGHLALDPFGLTADRPVARLREAIEIVRAVTARRATDGYVPPEHAMPPRAVPVWVGARGPQLVRTATRFADGLFVSGCTIPQLDAIRTVADSAGGTSMAIYQSATTAPTQPNEHGWHDIAGVLAEAVDLHRPTSIGVNLVDGAADPDADLVDLVHRAAAVLPIG